MTACHRRRASSSAAAHPRSSPGADLADVLTAIPIEGGAEITVECNPDDVTVELLTRVRRGGRQPGEHRGAVDGRPRARLARPQPRPAQRRNGRGGSPDGGIADVQSRRDLRRGGGAVVRLAHDRGVDPRSRPAARVGVRPDDRGRHAARRRSPTGIPTTTTRPTSTSSADAAARRRRARELRGLELGPPRARVPAQPRVLAPAGLHRVRLRGPLAPGRAAVVERAHARPLHRARRAATADRGVRRDARRRDAPDRRAAAGAADARRRARSTRSTATSSTAWSSTSGTAGCSPAPAASSPTRSRSTCTDPALFVSPQPAIVAGACDTNRRSRRSRRANSSGKTLATLAVR